LTAAPVEISAPGLELVLDGINPGLSAFFVLIRNAPLTPMAPTGTPFAVVIGRPPGVAIKPGMSAIPRIDPPFRSLPYASS
jgi:hypothetical protein